MRVGLVSVGALGESEAEDGGFFGEAIVGVGDAGGEDVGDAVVFDQVVFAVVEGGHGDVVGDAIGDEDEVFDVVGFEDGAEFFGEEAVVKFFACGFDGVEVVGVL